MNATETSPAAYVPAGAPPATTSAGGDERTSARRLIATYLVLTFGLSAIWYVLIIRAGTLGAGHGLYVLGLMWSPGISALLTRLLWQHNLRGEGWRWGATKWQLWSYAIPILYAAAAYGAVWLLGLGGLREDRLLHLIRSPLQTIGLFLTLGTAANSVAALGEELGWRGLLVPELAKLTSFTKLSLISGAIWATWHMPLIFFADYNRSMFGMAATPKLYAAACFTVMVVSFSFILAWLRLRSGSVWTAMFLHASHNGWIQSIFDALTLDTGRTRFFTTEFGAALALTTLLGAVLFWRLRTRLPGAGPSSSVPSPEAEVVAVGS